jgi:hypothetical protein
VKKIYSSLGVVIVIILIYGYVWFDSYQNSKTFFAQAETSLVNKNFGVAIKGDEAYSEKSGKYEYIGGFDQVVSVWKNPWAWPKPAIYSDAKERIHSIIKNDLTPEQGVALVQMYIGQSNEYLPEILIESTRKLIGLKRDNDANDLITYLVEAFGSNPDIKKEADELAALIKR